MLTYGGKKKVASHETLALVKKESLRHLTAERDRLLQLSHQEALDKLLQMAGVSSRIAYVERVEHGLLLEEGMMTGVYPDNSVHVVDGIAAVKEVTDSSVHLILSDIPYGIGLDTWDVLHGNTNSAFSWYQPGSGEGRESVSDDAANLLMVGRCLIARYP